MKLPRVVGGLPPLNMPTVGMSPLVNWSLLFNETPLLICRSRLLPNVWMLAPRPSARFAVRGAQPGHSCTDSPWMPLPAYHPVKGLKPGKAEYDTFLPVPETARGRSEMKRFLSLSVRA